MFAELFIESGSLVWIILVLFIYLWIAGFFVIVFYKKTKFIYIYLLFCSLILILGIISSLYNMNLLKNNLNAHESIFGPLILSLIFFIPLLTLGLIALILNKIKSKPKNAPNSLKV